MRQQNRQQSEVTRKQRKDKQRKEGKKQNASKEKAEKSCKKFEGKDFEEREIFFRIIYNAHIRTHTHAFIVVREREDRRKDEAVDAVAAEMFGSEVVEFA